MYCVYLCSTICHADGHKLPQEQMKDYSTVKAFGVRGAPIVLLTTDPDLPIPIIFFMTKLLRL